MKRICLITNFNLYESKRYFTEKLSEAMQRRGITTKIIDVHMEALSAETVQAIRQFDPDLTCSFNSFEPVDETRYLWDVLEVPHLSILVDPSFYSTKLINSPYSILSCVDRSDCEVVQSSGFNRVFFWPHAVERELHADPQEERIYDVVLLGSCYDYESLRRFWQQKYPASLSKVLDEASDLVFSNEKISLGQALVAAWQASRLDPTDVDFGMLYYYLDTYTRGKDRVELVRSIKNAHVHVFGDLATDDAVGKSGWAQYLNGQSNVTVHPPTLFAEGLDILKHSKIVLNSMPFFRDGSHERIFTGLACGCVPLTSESLFLREQFIEDEELLFYQSKHKDQVDGKICDLLSRETKRKAIAAKGRDVVMQRHTWDQRVETLISKAQSLLRGAHTANLFRI